MEFHTGANPKGKIKMTNIYWKSPGGTIHKIPEGSTVYVVGTKDMEEVWVNEDGYASNQHRHVSGAIYIGSTEGKCLACGSELISSTTGGLVKYCPKDGCEKMYRCRSPKT